MAIYGIEAFHEDTDLSQQFIKKNMAFVVIDSDVAPSLHIMMGYIRVGDIIYIKYKTDGAEIGIKAIGIVTDGKLVNDPELGTGVSVKWTWQGNDNIRVPEEKYNVRSNILHEEFDPAVQKEILQRFLSGFKDIQEKFR